MDEITRKELKKLGYRMADKKEFDIFFADLFGESEQKVKMEVIKKIQTIMKNLNLSPCEKIVPLAWRPQ